MPKHLPAQQAPLTPCLYCFLPVLLPALQVRRADACHQPQVRPYGRAVKADGRHPWQGPGHQFARCGVCEIGVDVFGNVGPHLRGAWRGSLNKCEERATPNHVLPGRFPCASGILPCIATTLVTSIGRDPVCPCGTLPIVNCLSACLPQASPSPSERRSMRCSSPYRTAYSWRGGRTSRRSPSASRRSGLQRTSGNQRLPHE